MISMKWDGHKEALLKQKYLKESMPLLTSNHSFKTCGSDNPFTSTTILKKCGGKNTSKHKCYKMTKKIKIGQNEKAHKHANIKGEMNAGFIHQLVVFVKDVDHIKNVLDAVISCPLYITKK